MASMDDRRHDLSAEVAARSGRAAPVVIPLVAALAFGAADQLVPWAAVKSSNLSLSLFAVQVSKMSAPWLLEPFLAGAWQASRRRAATLGLAATWRGSAGRYTP
jgi:hypothetical protein